ncbi:MAG: NAD(P)-dependent oxidoreductase [Deltaproteobacteria bacterium]|nr:NAD(P)-dependent oxidoreductase [Deltaproteobacteria bacterium]
MRTLVTGGLGKVGEHVVDELLRGGHEVTVLDRLPGPRDGGGARYLVGEVQDLGQMMEAAAGSDAIIHLAAIHNPHVAPTGVVFETNVTGTFNAHHAAFRLGIPRVVSTSSNAAVGWAYSEGAFMPDYLPIDEEHPCRPIDAYGLSKQVGETIAHSYARKGVETVVIRPSGVVTPEALEEIRRAGGREAGEWREYSYIDVRDLAVAFRLAVERPVAGGTVMFVVADDSTVTEPLCNVLPRINPAIGDRASALTGAESVFTNAKAKEILGWKPRHSWR